MTSEFSAKLPRVSPTGENLQEMTWQATNTQVKGSTWHDMTWDMAIQYNARHILMYFTYIMAIPRPIQCDHQTGFFFNSISTLPPSPCYRPDTWQPPLFELLAVASVRHTPSKWRGHTARFEWVQVRLGEKPKLPPQKKASHKRSCFLKIFKRW